MVFVTTLVMVVVMMVREKKNMKWRCVMTMALLMKIGIMRMQVASWTFSVQDVFRLASSLQ